MMRIRELTEKDIPQTRELMRYCFLTGEENLDMFLDLDFPTGTAFGAFDGDRLTASLLIRPYRVWLHGEWRKMGGLGSVATFPEFRYQKRARELIITALERMQEDGQIFSYLKPFQYEYYRKYGWEIGFEQKEYRLKINDFARFGNKMGRFFPMDANDIERLARVYDGFARGYHGAVERTKRMWENKLKWLALKSNLHHIYGLKDDDGEIRAYIIYRMNEKTFYVSELAYTSLWARHEMFRFIYMHNAQAENVVFYAPQDDFTHLELRDSYREMRLSPGMMVRAVNVKSALEILPARHDGSFTIRVIDYDFTPWNHHDYRVMISEGVVDVEECHVDRVDMECSIQSFSQLALGYIGIDRAIRMGRVAVHHEGNLSYIRKIFPEYPTWMNEHF